MPKQLLTIESTFKQGHRTYTRCLCICGVIKTVRLDHIRSGRTVSCGCYLKHVMRGNKFAYVHGEGDFHTPEYRSWQGMIRRCYTPTWTGFQYWGGRGIRVCSRWKHSYQNFLRDMGRKPGKTYSLDRINNDGHYEPRNCRWATAKQQTENRNV